MVTLDRAVRQAIVDGTITFREYHEVAGAVQACVANPNCATSAATCSVSAGYTNELKCTTASSGYD